MKKVLIALLALGTLSFAPSAEAGNGRRGYATKKSKNAPEKPCDNCVTTTRHVGTSYKDVMVPGKQHVEHYEKETTCTTSKIQSYSECGVPECATK